MFDKEEQQLRNQKDPNKVPMHMFKKNGSGSRRVVKGFKTIKDYTVQELVELLRKRIDVLNGKRHDNIFTKVRKYFSNKTIINKENNSQRIPYSVIPKYDSEKFYNVKSYRDSYKAKLWKMCLDLNLF